MDRKAFISEFFPSRGGLLISPVPPSQAVLLYRISMYRWCMGHDQALILDNVAGGKQRMSTWPGQSWDAQRSPRGRGISHSRRGSYDPKADKRSFDYTRTSEWLCQLLLHKSKVIFYNDYTGNIEILAVGRPRARYYIPTGSPEQSNEYRNQDSWNVSSSLKDGERKQM